MSEGTPENRTAVRNEKKPPFWPPPPGFAGGVDCAAVGEVPGEATRPRPESRSQWQVIGRRLLVLLGILMLLAGVVATFLGLGLIGLAGTGGAIALCMGFAFLGLALVAGGAVLIRRIFRTRGMPNTLVGGWPAAVVVSIGLFGLFGMLAVVGVVWWLTQPYP